MGLNLIHKAKDLSPEQKLLVENLLGRRVLEDEAISVRAFKPFALSDERRREIAEELKRYFAEIDAQRKHGSADAVDAILDEAIRRPCQFSSASVRIVLDTTILVRATDKTHGPARDLLLIIVSGKPTLVLSSEILHEVATAGTDAVLSFSWIPFLQTGSSQSVEEYKSVNEASQALINRQLHLVRPADGRGIHRVLQKAPTSAGIDLYCA